MRLIAMTEDTKKVTFWTAGITAAILAAIVVLWLSGVLEPAAVQ